MRQHGLLQRQHLVHHRAQLAAAGGGHEFGVAARRSASVTVFALKVANDSDRWNAANSSRPKSAGG